MTPCSYEFPVSLGDRVFVPRIGVVGEIVSVTLSQNQNQQVIVAYHNKVTGRSATDRFFVSEIQEPRQ